MLSINTTSFISYADPSYLSLSHGFEQVSSRSSTAETCYTQKIPQKYREEGFYTYFFSLNRTPIHRNKDSLERDGLHGLRGVPVRVKDLTSAAAEQHKHQLHLPATAIRSSQHSKSQKSNKFVPITVLGWHQALHIVEKEICNFKKRGESKILQRLQNSGSDLN